MQTAISPPIAITAKTIPTPRAFLFHLGRALLWVVGPFILINILTKLFMVDPSLLDLRNALKVIVLLAAYWHYIKRIEKREVHALSLTGAGKEIGAGLLLGSLVFLVTVGVLALFGAYHVDAVSGWSGALSMAPKIIAGAIVEEILFRLLLFRLLEAWLGSAIAIAATAVLFGLAHVGNPGATWFTTLALGIEGGIFFAAAYMLTRRLWLCAAAHFAWNFSQGGIFGVAVSGNAVTGLLQGKLTGPDWLTGGAFGLEGSAVAVVICTGIGIWMVVRVYRRGEFIR